MDLKVYMDSLRSNPRFTEEMLQLVEEDLRFGLTPKETEKYTGKRLDYLQMKVYSRCFRNAYGEEVMEVITKEGLTGEQMAVALEFYEKGVPLSTIREVTQKADKTAFAMKKLFMSIRENLEETQQQENADEAYAKLLLGQIKEIVEKISFQEKRYDALNEKLKEIGTNEQCEKIKSELTLQLAEKDSLLEKQQNEINEARVAVARLRNEIDAVGREKQELEKELEKMRQQVKASKLPVPEEKDDRAAEVQREEMKTKTAGKDMQGPCVSYPSLPVEYQTVVVDENGKIIQMLPIERVTCKKNKSILTSLFSRICLRKKTDLVKLVAEKGLEPKQLVQVRKGMEKGLTEQQLIVLINPEIPAEQMEEIISVAVYENRQRGEV